jgi:hypothetical protein
MIFPITYQDTDVLIISYIRDQNEKKAAQEKIQIAETIGFDMIADLNPPAEIEMEQIKPREKSTKRKTAWWAENRVPRT